MKYSQKKVKNSRRKYEELSQIIEQIKNSQREDEN